MQWMGMMMECCGMAVKGTGMLVSMRKMKVLAVKMGTVTLISKADRIRHPLCMKCMNLEVKYTFLADILFLGVVLEIYFPLEERFYSWVILELSCVQVNMLLLRFTKHCNFFNKQCCLSR